MEIQRAVHLQLPTLKTIDVEFENIIYTVPDGRKRKKHVINGVSGKFKAGELTAIMGPSGAGKTSLLNILTGFQSNGVKGAIKCNGVQEGKIGARQFKKQSCYILQDDQLSPHFTVDEIMNMACNLKLGYSVSANSKNIIMDEILDTLSLTSTKNTYCSRLSGGQRKRLSVALELIDNPPIMFLDEPTTGLDSLSSAQCIQMLKSLAAGGRTIICTIHQPSASIYEMFAHVYIMAQGKCIYQGASLNTVPYLASVGLQCPQYHNPSDYLLEVANGEYGCYTEALSKRADDKKWRRHCKNDVKLVSCEVDSNQNGHQFEVDVYTKESNDNINTVVLVQPPSEWIRFHILLKRIFLQMYRDWTVSSLKFVMHLLVGMLLGFTYYKTGNDGSKLISNVGFFLVSAVYLCYTSLMPAVVKFPSELPVLRKERFNNWYKLKTYYLAFLVADIPMQMLFSLAYTTTSYFISDQPYDLMRFLMVLLMLTLVTLTASSIGLLLGTTVDPINGTFLGAILTAFLLSVAGFLLLFTHMSKSMYALTYISFLSYAMEGLVQATYGYDRAPLVCPENVDYCHFLSPMDILRELGMDRENYWIDAAFLIVHFIVMRCLTFCTLKKRLSHV